MGENASKELPHDLLAERSLLGCLLIDGGVFDEVIDLGLSSSDFFHPKYGHIFDTIHELASSMKPIDLVTVCSLLNDNNKIEAIGGESFILDLVEDQASPVNAYHYATIVKEKSSLRKIIRLAIKVVEQGTHFSGQAQEFISDFESKFFTLTTESRVGGLKSLKHFLHMNLKELSSEAHAPGEIQGLSTGFKDLDEKLLGMQPGQLIIIAARPAMGKTSFALNLAVNSCRQHKLPVAIFSLEMLSNELSMRVLSSEAKVDSRKIRSKNFYEQDLKNISHAIQDLSGLPLFINDSGSITVLDIQSQCRKIKAENGLGLVIIDYLQLMKSHSKNPSREQQISEISRSLKLLAKELECPIIALSQLNRGVEARTEKRPMVSDLRESGSIEQDADIVLLVYRDEVYDKNTKDQNIAEIIVGKNRSGEVGTVKLSWIGAYTTFGNLTYRSEDEGPRPLGNA